MDTKAIVGQLQAELARVEAAIDAIEALDSSSANIPKPKPKSAAQKERDKPGKKRKLSAAGRAKIAAAAKARWARVHAIAEAGKAKKK